MAICDKFSECWALRIKNSFSEGEKQHHFESELRASNSARRLDRQKLAGLNRHQQFMTALSECVPTMQL
jgi:hypothetical protein